MSMNEDQIRELIRETLLREFRRTAEYDSDIVNSILEKIKQQSSQDIASLKEAQDAIREAFQSSHNPNR